MGIARFNTLIKSIAFSFCAFSLGTIASELIVPTKSQTFSAGWELWYPYQYHNEQNKLTGVDNIFCKEHSFVVTFVCH